MFLLPSIQSETPVTARNACENVEIPLKLERLSYVELSWQRKYVGTPSVPESAGVLKREHFPKCQPTKSNEVIQLGCSGATMDE